MVYEDDDFIAFRDINPQAPVHILIVPKVHIPSVVDLSEEHAGLMGRMILLASRIAKAEKISVSGYRLVINAGPDGTQVVPHIHLHVVGGRRLDGNLG
jgi:histidine triad (HIT) family protein